MKYFFSLLICILLTVCTSHKNDQASKKPEIFNNGTMINYNISGSGDTTLLFVHGWCINQTYWDHQVSRFESKYQVVTLDLPGHGASGSERSQWTIENFGEDVSMIINALNLENVVLVGHSMGGNIILEAANNNQNEVIGFVGVDNFKQLGIEYTLEQLAEYENFISMLKHDFGSTSSGFAEGMLFSETTSEIIKERVVNDIVNSNPQIAVPILESLITLNVKERGLMQQLQLKVHLINSDAISTDLNQLNKYCATSYEVHSIGRTGHYPMIEKPEKFNNILAGILNNL